MKPLFTIAAVTLSLALPGSASALNGRFMGGGTIFNFSNACVNAGWTQNAEYYTVRYQPRNVGNNADRDTLTFIGNSHAFMFQLNGASFSRSWTPVRHAFLGSGIGYSNEGDTPHADIRVTSMAPAQPNASTTAAVRIRGQARYLGHVDGCRVNFDVIVQQQQ